MFSDGPQTTGGPAVMVWGWVVVGKEHSFSPRASVIHQPSKAFFTMMIGLAMAGTPYPRIRNRIAFVTPSFRDLQRTSD